MADPAESTKPEIDILVCCARRTLDGVQLGRVRQRLAQPVNWSLLVQLANENGLLPLLCEHLLENFADAVPPEIAAQLRAEKRQSALRSLFLTAELLRIVELFEQSGLRVLPYKGPVTAQLAYGNPSLRHFDDLDIVVPHRFMPQVYERMQSLGYQAKLPRERFVATDSREIPGEYVFVHKVNGAMVEFHTERTFRHFPHPPDFENMAVHSATVCLNNRDVRTFANSDMLLMLCVHGAKDFWSRLVWLADIVSLIEKCTDEDWKRLAREAETLDAGRILNIGLWLARSIFDFQPPMHVSQRIDLDRVAGRIGNELRNQLLSCNELPEGIVWRSLYRIRSVSGIAKGLRYWLRLSTAPAEEDWSAGDGAPSSRTRFAFVRPLRLWRKYGRSLRAEKPRDKN